MLLEYRIRRSTILAFVFFFLTTASANAQVARLSRLREALLPFRQNRGDMSDLRGATPAFEGIKRSLRDFVESRLAGFTPEASELRLADEINKQLGEAGLFCGSPDPCPEQSSLGFLDNVEIRFQPNKKFLVVKTAVGTPTNAFPRLTLSCAGGNRISSL